MKNINNFIALETLDKTKKKSIWIHLIAMFVVIGLPFLLGNTEEITFKVFIFFVIPSVLILGLFYVNFYYLINKFLFPKKYALYIVCNIGLIIGCIFALSGRHYMALKKNYKELERIQFIKNIELENSKAENERFKRLYKDIKDYHHNMNRKNLRHGPYGHNSKKHLTGFILIGCISILTSVGIKSNQQVLNESNKRKFIENEYLKSKNAFLSYQIQPHFFFNTLNSIHALIDISKEDAKNTLIDLSKLMRYVLNVSEQEEVSVKKEIEFLKNYCDLMRLRISDDFKFNFETILSSSDKQIAPLLLIVLVENAFKHGVSGLNSDFIKISCIENNDALIFSVHNSKYENTVQTSQDSSIGIENLKTRLNLMYPNRHNLSISESENDYKSILTITS